MMAVDTSALVAIILREPDAKSYSDCLVAAPGSIMSAVSMMELSFVALSRLGQTGLREVDGLIEDYAIRIIPFDGDQAARAVDAFRRFGKGRHKASLNMGDCASYALAASHSLPLLYKGADFANTDMQTALPA